MSTADDITRECAAIRDLLLAKNAAYGDSALDPVRIFSQADPVEQIRVRIDDKLSRLGRGKAAGEDVEQDLFGYLVLLRIAKSRAANMAPREVPKDQRLLDDSGNLTDEARARGFRITGEAPKRPQPGDTVQWSEVEDGCLYERPGYPCRFAMVAEGRIGVMGGEDDCDLPAMVEGEYGERIAAFAAYSREPCILIARDLGNDIERWRAAMRAHLTESAKP